AKINSGFKIGKGNLFVRSSFWTRKQWAIASGGALAAVVLVVTISVPNLLRSREPASAAYYYDKQLANDSLSGGTVGKIQAHQRLGNRSNEATALVAPVAGPIATSSDDGEPITEKARGYATPMIARTVSLSIV